jgi:hypothetical protein
MVTLFIKVIVVITEIVADMVIMVFGFNLVVMVFRVILVTVIFMLHIVILVITTANQGLLKIKN